MTNCCPELGVTGNGDREHERNRVLRRVDWRFLLPNPSPDVAVCFTRGDLLNGVTRISRVVLTEASAGRDSCDLAVALNPRFSTLRAAHLRLRPGAACYVEFTGRSLTRARVRRRLAAAGLETPRLYRPWPSTARCVAWLPLQPSWVARAYFKWQAPTSASMLRRALRRARRTLSRFRQTLGSERRVCAVATKPHRPGLDLRMPDLAVADGSPARWDETGLHGPPERTHVVLQTGGQRSTSKVVALLFPQHSETPQAVVKIARVPEAAAGLINEADTLDALQRMAHLPTGVPRLLFRRPIRNGFAVGETALRGEVLPSVTGSDRYRTIAEAATDWLIQLALASIRSATSWPQVSAPALGEFETAYGPVLQPSLLALLRRTFAAVRGLPTVCEHRDFSPWNVVTNADRTLSVYDWESSVLSGVPGLDLIYFLSYMSPSKGGLQLNSYRAAWDPSTSVGRINQRCVATYARALGITPSSFAAIRQLTWLVHSRSEYQRFVADCGGAPPGAVLRSGLFLALVTHEVAVGQGAL